MIPMDAVGTVACSRAARRDDDWDEETATITLDARFGPEALAGLDSFSHVAVLFCMTGIDPGAVHSGARHPRGNTAWPRVGIFAQRASKRPNRIGLTVCRVLRVEGRTVHVAGLDALDGTPVLDLKPWVAGFGPRGAVKEPEWVAELMAGYWGGSSTGVPSGA